VLFCCSKECVQKNEAVFLTAVDQLTISYVFPKCTNKNLGEEIMQKTNSDSVFNEISANFKGEIHNVKIGRGGGDTRSE
jgi:hypothetical protein